MAGSGVKMHVKMGKKCEPLVHTFRKLMTNVVNDAGSAFGGVCEFTIRQWVDQVVSDAGTMSVCGRVPSKCRQWMQDVVINAGA